MALIASTTSASRAHRSWPRPARAADLGQGRAPGAAADDAGGAVIAHALAPLRPGTWVGLALGGGLVQRPARPGHGVQAVDQALGQALGAGQGDHGGVVGAIGQRRGEEVEAVGLAARSLQRTARTARLAATPPATTKRSPACPWVAA